MKKRGRLQKLNIWQGLKWEIGSLTVLPCWKIPIWTPHTTQLVCVLRSLHVLLDPAFTDIGLPLRLKSSQNQYLVTLKSEE